MALRLAAPVANSLQGYELEFEHSATGPPPSVAGGDPAAPLQRAFERLANLCAIRMLWRHRPSVCRIYLLTIVWPRVGLTLAEATTQTSRLSARNVPCGRNSVLQIVPGKQETVDASPDDYGDLVMGTLHS